MKISWAVLAFMTILAVCIVPGYGSYSAISSSMADANFNVNPGTYGDNIITASGAINSPVKVPVVLTFSAATPPPPPPPAVINPAEWGYGKQFSIAGSALGILSNYQVKLIVNKGTGTDSAGNVYLNNHCRDDFGDIRFTGADGVTLLDYWVESSVPGVSAVVWVELDAIPARPGIASFYCYYGNSGAATASNIQNTFVFGDDFNDTTLDTAGRWTVTSSSGSYSESGGTLTVTGGKEVIRSKATYDNQYALHARVRLDQVVGSNYRIVGFNDTYPDYNKYYTSAFCYYPGDTSFTAITGDGTSGSTQTLPVNVDTNFHMTECRRYSSEGVNYSQLIIDGKPELNGIYPTDKSRSLTITAEAGSNSIILDWLFLRKFVSPEPAWGAWGAEQPGGATIVLPVTNYLTRSRSHCGCRGH
ncbi:MAG: DUF2341 domain-containing protein [Dehalococcoidia bacterium]|jgi:hypothetical protein